MKEGSGFLLTKESLKIAKPFSRDRKPKDDLSLVPFSQTP